MKRSCAANQEVVDVSSDEESTEDQPAKNNAMKEKESVLSQEVFELKEKVAKLEKDLQSAYRHARQFELQLEESKKRVEFLENLHDKKPALGDDGEKKLMEKQQRIDELERKLAQYEGGLQRSHQASSLMIDSSSDLSSLANKANHIADAPMDLPCPIESIDQDSIETAVVARPLVIHGSDMDTIGSGFPCPEKNCRSVLASRATLRDHRNKVHAPKNHTCKMCDKAFPERGRLIIHERSHTGEKPFKCTVDGCEMAFAQNWYLNAHIKKVHHNDAHPGMIACKMCGVKFASNFKLRVHPCTQANSAPANSQREQTRRNLMSISKALQ